jgi:hypothetical protein
LRKMKRWRKVSIPFLIPFVHREKPAASKSLPRSKEHQIIVVDQLCQSRKLLQKHLTGRGRSRNLVSIWLRIVSRFFKSWFFDRDCGFRKLRNSSYAKRPNAGATVS